jgi:hypothetical protein
MPFVKPREIVDRSNDDQYLRDFIDTATTAATADMNATRVASEIHLAKAIKSSGDGLESAISSMTESLRKALTDHADALIKSAHASEKYARSLNFATWALVAATVVLAIITAIPLVMGQIK